MLTVKTKELKPLNHVVIGRARGRGYVDKRARGASGSGSVDVARTNW
jgi:hypothetical protein